MKKLNFLESNCRHCRFYQPEGRRGGACQKLGVAVESTWTACSLASSPFEETFNQLDTTLTNLEKTLINLEEIVHLETAFSLPAQPHGEQYPIGEEQKTLSLPYQNNHKLKQTQKPNIIATKKAPIQ